MATTKSKKPAKARATGTHARAKTSASAKALAPVTTSATTTKSPFFRRLRNYRLARFTLLVLAPFLVLESFFFVNVLKDYNYIEVFPHAFLFSTELQLGTALLIGLAVYFVKWPRNIGAKLVSATLLGMLLTGYDDRLQAVENIYRAVMPIKPADDAPLISLLFLLTLLAMTSCIGVMVTRLQRRHTQLSTENTVLGVMVMVGFVFLSQFMRIAHVYPHMLAESKVQAPSLGKPATKGDGQKPDIYYIVLDRYASDQTLQSQFNYQNPFTNFLKTSNFQVNSNAYANYPYTPISISSTINAQYTDQLVVPYKDSDVQSRTLYHNLIRQSSVIKALKQNGYQYYSIGSSYGASNRAPLADRDYMWDHLITFFGHQKRLRGIEATEFLQSPFYRFGQVAVSWWPFKAQDHTQIDDVRDQLNNLTDLSKDSTGGHFVFAHFLVPHDPFYFNADGSFNAHPDTANDGKAVKQKYLGQVQFISDQMQGIVSNIQKSSGGKAVILFNADEGPYPQVMNQSFLKPNYENAVQEDGVVKGDMRAWPDDWLRMKFGILQAAYIPKATEADQQHLSSVNLFRIVLNRYLGYSLNYLPDCHYALSSGSQAEYNYGDITHTLLDTESPQCKQMENLPTAPASVAKK
jgi:hypothetical protein